MKSKLKLNNSSRNNNSLNTLSFSSKNKILNSNGERNNSKIIYNYSRKAKNKEFINNKQNNDINKINNEKNAHLKKINFNNAYLSPLNYAKSLNLLINNKVQAKNTQFINYKKSKIIKKNNNDFLGNNKFKYNANFPKNEETKLKENSQYILRNKKVTQNIKLVKNKNDNNNIKSNIKYNNNKSDKLEINKKVATIQAIFRGYFIRYKLYNTLLLNTILNKFVNILQKKLIYNERMFLNNIILKGKEKQKQINNENENENEKYQKNINDKNMKYDKNLNYIILDINNNSNYININNNINNININNNKIININKESNTFIEERKLYEKEIEELKNENEIMKEKNKEYQKNEEEYKNLKAENEKLSNLNNDINKEKEKLLLELKSKDEEFQKLLKEKNNFNFDISKPVEINIYHEKNKVNSDLNNNGEVKEINSDNNNENNINSNINNNVKENNNYKLTREKCLKNIFNIKNNKIKGYIHKCFGKFYYNGIFLQMTGKLNHLSKKLKSENKAKDKNNFELNIDNIPETSEIILESKDSNKNEIKTVQELPENNKNEIPKKDNPVKKVTFKEELVENENPNKVSENKEKVNNEDNKDKNALEERLKKSRGLRKLMNKKAHEKQEMLRHYFYRFYRQGIYSQFRKAQRRRSVEFNAPQSLDIEGILHKKEPQKVDDTFTRLKQKQEKEKEELRQKVVKLLKRIFYKTDRRNMVILSKKFKRYYLIVRFETLKNMISVNKVHKLKKKKRKKSHKKIDSFIVNEEEIQNSENDKNENDKNE